MKIQLSTGASPPAEYTLKISLNEWILKPTDKTKNKIIIKINYNVFYEMINIFTEYHSKCLAAFRGLNGPNH